MNVHGIGVACAFAALVLGCGGAAQQETMKESKPAPAKVNPAQDARGDGAALAARCARSIEAARALRSQIVGDKAPRTHGSVLEPYNRLRVALDNAANEASLMRVVHPEAGVREAAEKCEQEVSALGTELDLDRGLYEAFVALDLSKEDALTQRYVKNLLRDFRRAGVDKDEATRKKVRALADEIVKIGQVFTTNITKDRRVIDVDPKDAEGLPADWLKAHAPNAKGRLEVSTDYPDYIPFLTYAKGAHARQKLYVTYQQRGFPHNEAVLRDLLAKRFELARLLGYANWAAFVTEDKMMRTEKRASEFIDRLDTLAARRTREDTALLLAEKRKDEPNAKTIHEWEWSFYKERVQKAKYGYDSQKAREYFPYPRVRDGLAEVVRKLFGVTMVANKDAPRWHPDVEAFDLYRGAVSRESRIGLIYLDMHPRADKYKHAAQFSIQSGVDGIQEPQGALVCNFPKPSGDDPGLMQYGEVRTFFHEFGHLMHHMLAGRQRWAKQSGVATEWDFVEVPSQLLEEWTREMSVLSLFARHWKTGETIPKDLVQRMNAADNVGKGMWTRRQIALAAISLHFYDRDPKGVDLVKEMIAQKDRYNPFPHESDTYFIYSFGHLEGYSAIYYTYLWSLVIAKDLAGVFKKAGFLDEKTARRYTDTILVPGGSKDAADLVREFLGREFGFKAFEAWLGEEG